MNWLILLIGAASAMIAFILLLFRSLGGPFYPMPGNERPPLDLERPLPIQLYDRDPRVQEEWQSESAEMSRAFDISLEDARRICEEMRPANSAVVELNIAKLTLDLVERHGQSLTPDQMQELLDYIEEAIYNANWFIEHHGQERYVADIYEYLEYQENRLRDLTG